MQEILHELETSKSRLLDGLREINQSPDFNSSTVEVLGEVVDIIKDICEIKEKTEGKYSGNMYSGRNYSGDGWQIDAWRMPSRGRSYGDKNQRINQIKDMMNSASSDQEYRMYQGLLKEMENS